MTFSQEGILNLKDHTTGWDHFRATYWMSSRTWGDFRLVIIQLSYLGSVKCNITSQILLVIREKDMIRTQNDGSSCFGHIWMILDVFFYCDITKELKEDFGNIPRRNDPKWLNIPGNTVPVNQIGVTSSKNTSIVPSQQVVGCNIGGWAAKHVENRFHNSIASTFHQVPPRMLFFSRQGDVFGAQELKMTS